MAIGRLTIAILLLGSVFSAFAEEVTTQFRNPTNEVLSFKYTCQKQVKDLDLRPGEVKLLPLSECPYWEGYIGVRVPNVASYFAKVGEKFIFYRLSADSRIRMENDDGQVPECWSSSTGNYPRYEDGSCD